MAKSVYDKAYRVLLNALVEERKAAHLTQEQVAKRLDKYQSFMAKTENGERRLDVVEMVQIAKAIKADPIKLLKAVIDAL